MLINLTFDTLEFTRKLRDAGFDEKQAEAVVRAIVKSHSELATKADLDLMSGHFDMKIDLLRAENAHTRWMLGIVIALAVANFAKQFF